MTAQDRPFVSLASGDEFCAHGKCLRKCQYRTKPDHYHAQLGDACHEGECWPKGDRWSKDPCARCTSTGYLSVRDEDDDLIMVYCPTCKGEGEVEPVEAVTDERCVESVLKACDLSCGRCPYAQATRG